MHPLALLLQGAKDDVGWDVAGFADIQATALNAAISGSIFAVPEMTMALPFGSTRVVHRPRHQDNLLGNRWPKGR
jgi:hypothetical protein